VWKNWLSMDFTVATMLFVPDSLLVQAVSRQGPQVCPMLAIKISITCQFLLLLMIVPNNTIMSIHHSINVPQESDH
jgi:hypothetical protein